MRWFGESWGAPVCDPDEHIETPVGYACLYCPEPIGLNDRGFAWPLDLAAHLECFLAAVVPPEVIPSDFRKRAVM